MYVGKKTIWTRKAGKIVKQSKWNDYWSSSNDLLLEIEILGNEWFDREIVVWCETKKELTEREIEEQFKREVLRAQDVDGFRLYYNKNIMNKFFVPSAVKSPATIKKMTLARNKRKPINTFNYKKCVETKRENGSYDNLRVINNGSIQKTIKDDGDFIMPEGWEFGRLSGDSNQQSINSRSRYADNPKRCSNCQNTLNYEKRNDKTCSSQCSSERIRTAKKYDFEEQSLSLREWSEAYNIKEHLLRERIRKGWPFEKALKTPSAKQKTPNGTQKAD